MADEKFLFLLLIVIFLAAIIIGIQHWRTRCLLKRLDKMLDAAISGTFIVKTFDESMVSSIENKMDKYLSASETTARGLKQEKDKIKQLIADISHQTKTPIANLLLYVQLLEEQQLTGVSGEYVQALTVQSEKLNFLITSLIEMSRLETGILSLYPRNTKLAPMLAAVNEQFMPKAQQKHLTLTIETTEEQAVFDHKWTTEALGNLIDNAIKYTPAGGSVTVKTIPYELFCRVNVSDTGIGIPEDEQAKVFGRFYRSAAVADDEGVGIGLYMTRQILAEEGGYLKLTSVPGEGSTFSLFLPRT